MPEIRYDDTAGRISGGLLESVRTLFETLVSIMQTRAELLGTELEQELRRVVQLLVGTMIALALAVIAVLFSALLVVAALWDTHRIASIALVAAGFAALAVVSYFVTSRRARRTTRLLSATLDALEQDLRSLRRTPQ